MSIFCEHAVQFFDNEQINNDLQLDFYASFVSQLD